jgi:TetR/AcrR family fatty acid metabolism transcriptional regulator
MARKREGDKRRKILAAATKVFAKKGYFAAKVSEIARRAGIADGTIYLYFRSKEDILVSLFDEVMSEHVERAREELGAFEGAAARLQAIAHHHLRVLSSDRDLAVVFQVELRQSTKFMERFSSTWLRSYFDLVGEVVEQGQREGVLRSEVPIKLATKAFFGMLDEMVTSWVIAGRDTDLTLLAGPLCDLFLRGAAAQQETPASRARPALAVAASRGSR